MRFEDLMRRYSRNMRKTVRAYIYYILYIIYYIERERDTERDMVNFPDLGKQLATTNAAVLQPQRT